MKPICEPAM